jgi:signal transduction histidine kinase
MFLIALAVLGLGAGAFALAVIHADGVSAWIQTLPRRLRTRGWGLLLLPIVLQYALLTTQPEVGLVEVAAAALIVIFAPRVAAKAVPFALVILGLWGIILVRDLERGGVPTVLYGVVPAGDSLWPGRLVLPEAVLFIAAGAWLFLQVSAPGSGHIRALFRRMAKAAGGRPSRWALLLLPVLALAVETLGVRHWLGLGWWTAEWTLLAALILATGGIFLARSAPSVAALMAAAGLQVLGVYGLLLALIWRPVSGRYYGLVGLDYRWETLLVGLQAAAILAAGVYLMPRVVREHIAGAPDRELAALTERVETLTQTRTDAVDAAAAELRRIERDLHDGAQARLVALGMSLRAAEKMFASNPQAALALVTEARETSSRALTDLRDLVRGIYPPVLADRGLADAIRALALDTPLHTVVDVDLPGPAAAGGQGGRAAAGGQASTIEMPVGAAVYFAVAEALTNAVRHSGARTVRIHLRHAAGTLRAEVTDDGAGGADPAQGTGLAGVERRLATFDGILAISSPPGGPTIVAIEVPCALSSAKISSC